MPTSLEGVHRGLARWRVTVCGCSPVLISVGHCPRPRRPDGRCDRLEDVPDHRPVLANDLKVVQPVGTRPAHGSATEEKVAHSPQSSSASRLTDGVALPALAWP